MVVSMHGDGFGSSGGDRSIHGTRCSCQEYFMLPTTGRMRGMKSAI
jgi:hypothetical protein